MKMIYKVCLPGYGKTKWLVNKAISENNDGTTRLYVTSNLYGKRYSDFAEYYHATSGHVCSIPPVNIDCDKLSRPTTLFIDDAMLYEGLVEFLRENAEYIKTCYITINGELDNES